MADTPEAEDVEFYEDDPVEEIFAAALAKTPPPSAPGVSETVALALPTPAAVPARPSEEPATVWLSRYTSAKSRLTMAGSLRVLGGLLLGKAPEAVDPRSVPWAQVRYAHAQEVRAKLAAQYAPATANRHLVALRGVVRECWQLGLMSREDASRVEALKAVPGNAKEKGRALSKEEISALYAACGPGAQGRRDAAVLALTAQGGMRRAEVCGLDLEHWDAAQAKLMVLGKGNKWRSVYLPDAAKEALQSWLALRGDTAGPLLWPVSKHGTPVTGKRLTDHGVYDLLNALGKRAGVKGFTPHDLRRTFITSLLHKGADALTVSKLAGHANVQTTMRYDRRGEDAKVAAVALLNAKE